MVKPTRSPSARSLSAILPSSSAVAIFSDAGRAVRDSSASISLMETVAVPSFVTAIPAAMFAASIASSTVEPAARQSAIAEIDVSPAPDTSYTFLRLVRAHTAPCASGALA